MARIQALESRDFSGRLEIKNGKVTSSKSDFPEAFVIEDLKTLIEGFAEFLPDMTLQRSLHDVGSYIVRDDQRKAANKAVKAKSCECLFLKHLLWRLTQIFLDLTPNNITYFENGNTNPRRTLTKACADDSLAVQYEAQLGKLGAPRANNTCKPMLSPNSFQRLTINLSVQFIYDHRATMDYCKNPETLDSHGFWIYEWAHGSYWDPIFVGCKPANGAEFIVPPTYGYADYTSEDVTPWSERIGAVYWRGSATGSHFKIDDWRRSHRMVLHALTHAKDGLAEVLVEQDGKLVTKKFTKKELNWKYLDVSLSGEPIQCDQKDGACEDMAKNIEWAPPQPPNTGLKYKYAIDVGELLRCPQSSPASMLTSIVSRRQWLVSAIPTSLGIGFSRPQSHCLPGMEHRLADPVLSLRRKRPFPLPNPSDTHSASL